MQAAPKPQYQNLRHRGPKIAIPPGIGVTSVRYIKFSPKPAPELQPAPKIHLSFIPPEQRRRTGFLAQWLQPRKEEEEENGRSRSSSSSSGAYSQDTVTTDISSISSPTWKAPETIRVDLTPHYSQPVQPPKLLPAAAPPSQQLTADQWAELAHLQRQAALRTMQQLQHAPPKLMNIHMAYLPELDAAVREMMQQKPGPRVRSFHENGDRRSRAPSVNINGSSSGSSIRSQMWCKFCYDRAVYDAAGKQGAAHLPRVSDKGRWRGHQMKEGETIVCPRLLRRICPLCGSTGQSAHESNYCPVTKRHLSCY